MHVHQEDELGDMDVQGFVIVVAVGAALGAIAGLGLSLAFGVISPGAGLFIGGGLGGLVTLALAFRS